MFDQKTGKTTVGFLRNLTLRELSGVDYPANPGAHVVLHKRLDMDEVTKRYDTNDALPAVLKSLPAEMQTAFRETVNKLLALDTPEETAFKDAWSEVKAGFEKQDDKWVKKAFTPKKPSKEDAKDAAEEGGLPAALAAAAGDDDEEDPKGKGKKKLVCTEEQEKQLNYRLAKLRNKVDAALAQLNS